MKSFNDCFHRQVLSIPPARVKLYFCLARGSGPDGGAGRVGGAVLTSWTEIKSVSYVHGSKLDPALCEMLPPGPELRRPSPAGQNYWRMLSLGIGPCFCLALEEALGKVLLALPPRTCAPVHL